MVSSPFIIGVTAQSTVIVWWLGNVNCASRFVNALKSLIITIKLFLSPESSVKSDVIVSPSTRLPLVSMSISAEELRYVIDKFGSKSKMAVFRLSNISVYKLSGFIFILLKILCSLLEAGCKNQTMRVIGMKIN